MAARLIWMFLDDADVAHALKLLDEKDPGVVASNGRYLKGDPRALLENPSVLERRESVPGERRVVLFHRVHSRDIVVHEQPAGPFAGWSQIDEERSDCLVLRLGDAQAGKLEPARLYAHTNFWRGNDQTKKHHPFTKWVNASLKLLLRALPSTSVRFMHIGPSARKRAIAGELELTYLFRAIAPQPPPGPLALPVIQAPAIQAPPGTIESESSLADADEGASS